MPFNVHKHINDTDSKRAQIAQLTNEMPQLPTNKINDIKMSVEIKEGTDRNYPIVWMQHGENRILVDADSHLGVINFLKEIYQ